MHEHRCKDGDPVVTRSNIRRNSGPLKNERFAAIQFKSENHKIDDDGDDGKMDGRRDASVNGMSPPIVRCLRLRRLVKLPAPYHPRVIVYKIL